MAARASCIFLDASCSGSSTRAKGCVCSIMGSFAITASGWCGASVVNRYKCVCSLRPRYELLGGVCSCLECGIGVLSVFISVQPKKRKSQAKDGGGACGRAANQQVRERTNRSLERVDRRACRRSGYRDLGAQRVDRVRGLLAAAFQRPYGSGCTVVRPAVFLPVRRARFPGAHCFVHDVSGCVGE